MSKRVFWFVAGTAAGIWASVKAKRAAERISMPGLIDQASALGVGVRAFTTELNEGKRAKENEIRRMLLDEPQHWELNTQDVEVVGPAEFGPNPAIPAAKIELENPNTTDKDTT